MSEAPKSNVTIIAIVLLIVIVLLGANQVMKKSHKSGVEKAADDISDGVHNAAGEFKQKGPAEKAGDAIKNAGQKIKDSTE